MKRIIITLLASLALSASVVTAQAQAPQPQGGPQGQPGGPQAMERHDGPSRPGAGQQHHEPHHLAAQPAPRHQAPPPHDWRAGEHFNRHRAPHYARIHRIDHYGLQPPPPDHVWVRSGFDALLVRLSNNVIVLISPGMFR